MKLIKIEVPGRGTYEIEHVVFDMNGTLTRDGRIRNKVKDRLILLSKKVKTHIITSDTFGRAKEVFKKVPAEIVIIPEGSPADEFKKSFVLSIGSEKTVAVGNGYNDRLMLSVAALSICIVGPEGAYRESLENSHVVFTDPLHAIDFLLKPLRFKATLRN